MSERRFPIIRSPVRDPVTRRRGWDTSFRSIPWAWAEKAYAVYSERYGREQSLERMAQRGGFGVEELDLFAPGWREHASEEAA